MARRHLIWTAKEDIYKAYKHGVPVATILSDFNINIEKFKKVMREIGGSGFQPALFDEKTGAYVE